MKIKQYLNKSLKIVLWNFNLFLELMIVVIDLFKFYSLDWWYKPLYNYYYIKRYKYSYNPEHTGD